MYEIDNKQKDHRQKGVSTHSNLMHFNHALILQV